MLEDPGKANGWDDLGVGVKRKRTVTHFIRALKAAALLLPKAVKENQEVTVSSPNICKKKHFPFLYQKHKITEYFCLQ